MSILNKPFERDARVLWTKAINKSASPNSVVPSRESQIRAGRTMENPCDEFVTKLIPQLAYRNRTMVEIADNEKPTRELSDYRIKPANYCWTRFLIRL